MWIVEVFLAHWFFYSLAGIVVVVLLCGIRYIPNTKVGLVEKRASRKGSVTAGIIALNGESGFQPPSCAAACTISRPGSTRFTSIRWSDPSGEARLRLLARRRAAAADPSPRVQRRRQRFSGRRGLSPGGRPTRTAAEDSSRGHVRHQP